MQQLRRAPQRRVGREIDDARAALGLAQQRGQFLDSQPGAAGIDCHHPVPGLDVDFLEGPAANRGSDRAVVDQSVEPAVASGDRPAQGGDARGLAEIDRHEGRIDAVFRQRFGGLPPPILDQLGDDYRGCALRRRGFGEGPAEPAPGPGNRHDFAVEQAHQDLSADGLRGEAEKDAARSCPPSPWGRGLGGGVNGGRNLAEGNIGARADDPSPSPSPKGRGIRSVLLSQRNTQGERDSSGGIRPGL